MVNAAPEAAISRFHIRSRISVEKLFDRLPRDIGGGFRQIWPCVAMDGKPAVHLPFIEKASVEHWNAIGGLQRFRHGLEHVVIFNAPVRQAVVNHRRQRNRMPFPTAFRVKIAVDRSMLPVDMRKAKQEGEPADLFFLR